MPLANLLKSGLPSLVKSLKIVGVVLVLFVLVVGAHRIYRWLWPGPDVDVVIRSQILGVEEVETLYTGFSFVPVLLFSIDDHTVVEDLPTDEEPDGSELEEARGFCYRLYRVTLGFPDAAEALRSFREDLQAIPLEVLAANALESRQQGTFSQLRCDGLDRRSSNELHTWLQERMERDGQWPIQLAHARRLLTDLAASADLVAASAPTDLRRELHRGERKLAGQYLGVGYLGALEVTFSLVGLYSQERGRWFWRSEQFYVRRDLADAVYGSAVTADSFRMQRPWLGTPHLVVTLEEPRLIAVDRHIQTLVAKPPRFALADSERSIEQDLLDELQRRLDEIEPQAVETSRRLIRLRIQQAAGEEPFEIRFVRDIDELAGVRADIRRLEETVERLGQAQ